MYLSSGVKCECYGCRACAEVCPQECIGLIEDAEHFLYPQIDKTKCVHCHLCEKVCPASNEVLKNYVNKDTTRHVWVGVSKSKEVQFKSSSGGAFTEIYSALIAEGYVVFGVRWSENLKVIHDCATTIEECKAFRKSKYVMSNTNGCYAKVGTLLSNGKKVCFTGTPCQCAALRTFLSTKRLPMDNLIVIDLICHGAPSQYIFDKYISEKLGKRFCTSGISFQFKNKIPHLGKFSTRTAMLTMPNGRSKFLSIKNDPFLKGYYGRLFYRPSCGACQFAQSERVSDITLGDAWHIEKKYPAWNNCGVSCIIVNSPQGEKVVEQITPAMELHSEELEWVIENNSQFTTPTQMHKKREIFFGQLDSMPFSKAVKKAMNENLSSKIMRKIFSWQ